MIRVYWHLARDELHGEEFSPLELESEPIEYNRPLNVWRSHMAILAGSPRSRRI